MFTLLLDAVNPTSCNSEFFIWNDLELFCTFCCLFVSSKLLFIQGGHQFWALTPAGEVRRDEACLDHDGGPGPPVPPLLPIFLFVCLVKSLWCFVIYFMFLLCLLRILLLVPQLCLQSFSPIFLSCKIWLRP